MTCRECIHYNICSLWTTSDLDEDRAYKYCFGHFKSTSDVVEVVRCKDCKYHRDLDSGVKCERIDGLLMTLPSDYCSYGRRQDN